MHEPRDTSVTAGPSDRPGWCAPQLIALGNAQASEGGSRANVAEGGNYYAISF